MKKFLVSMMAVITAVLLVACSNASNKEFGSRRCAPICGTSFLVSDT